MPARDISGVKGRLLQAVFSRRFEGRAGYLLAIIAVGIVFALRLALQDILGNTAIFILFIPVILVAAIAGGIGPGLLAFVLSLAGAIFIAGASQALTVQVLVFSLVGLAIAWMGEMLHHARRALDKFEEALKTREAHLRSILDTAPDSTIVIDENGRITSFSAADLQVGLNGGRCI